MTSQPRFITERVERNRKRQAGRSRKTAQRSESDSPVPDNGEHPETAQGAAQPPQRPFRAALRWAFDQLGDQNLDAARELLSRHGISCPKSEWYVRTEARKVGWTSPPKLGVVDGGDESEADDTVIDLPSAIIMAVAHRGQRYALQANKRNKRWWSKWWVAKDGSGEWRPLLWGHVEVTAVGITHTYDRPTGRITSAERKDVAYKIVAYGQAPGERPVGEAWVRQRDLIANKPEVWAVESGLGDLAVKRVLAELPDLIMALALGEVIVGEREGLPALDGPVTPMVPTTGPVLPLDGPVTYLTGTGKAIDRNGASTAVAPTMTRKRRRQLSDIDYETNPPDFTDPVTVGHLDALVRPIYSHPSEARAVVGALTGQTVGSLMTGRYVGGSMGYVQSVIAMVDDSMGGKTTLADLFVSSQTRSLWGQLLPTRVWLVAKAGGAGGAKAAGVRQWLSDHGGGVTLMDEAGPRKVFDDRHKMDQHNVVLRAIADTVLGGGPGQAMVDKVADRVDIADDADARLSVVAPMECVPPVGGLMLDGTANRLAWFWWDASYRCPEDVLYRLQSEAETLARNSGLRVCLQLLLDDVGVLIEGYERALVLLREVGIPHRQAKHYARIAAGLWVIDRAYGMCGVMAGVFGDCLPAIVAEARRMVDYDTAAESGELAAVDPVEAFRWAWQHEVRSRRSVYYDAGPGEIGAEASEPTADQLPDGLTPQDLGWPHTAERSECVGRWVRHEGGRPHPFAYRAEHRASDWRSLCIRLAETCKQKGLREWSHTEITKALRDAGVWHPGRDRHRTHDIDGVWLTDVPDVIELENEGVG
jgi:hypothetical protein